MAVKYNYFLEDIDRSTSKDSDVHIATISCYDHRRCIEIYGTDDVLTERVVKVLEGLNRKD